MGRCGIYGRVSSGTGVEARLTGYRTLGETLRKCGEKEEPGRRQSGRGRSFLGSGSGSWFVQAGA